MGIQRPTRPGTRLGQPAVNPPTKAVRPSTGPVAKQSPPAPTSRGRSGPSTRSIQKSSPTRAGVQRPAPRGSSTLIAVAAGAVLLVGVGAWVLLGGSGDKHDAPPARPAAKPAAVDVSGLERDGLSKCQEGLALVKKNESLLVNHALTESQKSSLKGDLERGRKLIGEGMGLLTQANEKSGNKYDVTQYQEALITVRKKLMELRD